MTITETMLLDGYQGLTNSLSPFSTVKAPDGRMVPVHWTYRRLNEEAIGACAVNVREDADFITVEYDRGGRIELDADATEHAALAKIYADFDSVVGTAIDSQAIDVSHLTDEEIGGFLERLIDQHGAAVSRLANALFEERGRRTADVVADEINALRNT